MAAHGLSVVGVPLFRAGVPMNPWFRFYAKFMTDPDIEELSFEDQRHFVFVLCMKCEGLLDKDFGIDAEKRERAIGRRLGLQGEALAFAKQRLLDGRLINEDWHPRSWDRLQFKSDHDSAERQRRSRANRTVTTESRDSHTPEQNRTETEQKDAQPREPLPDGLNLEAWNRWETYRRKIRKPLKPESVPAAQRKLAGYGSDQSAVVEHSIANGYTGLWEPKEQAKPKPRIAGI
jgi:hypothetical protein